MSLKSFKEQVLVDLQNTFIDIDTFGEVHNVEGKDIKVVFDDDKLVQRQGGAELGVAESDLLLFALSSDLPPKKGPGSAINIDGREYVVNDWREDMGLSTVTLTQNRTI